MTKDTHNPYFKSRDKCPACACAKFAVIYEIPYESAVLKDYLERFYSPQGGVEFDYLKGASYILCRCLECGLIFQRDIPDDRLSERLYESWIDPKKAFILYQREIDPDYASVYSQEIKQLIDYFKADARSLCFLDFGMGWGDWSALAISLGCEVYGVELSKERIEYAASRGIKVLSFAEVAHRKFDFINAEHVFEHIAEPLDTLAYLKASLKERGLIKINVPTANDMAYRLKAMDWKAPKHSRYSLNPVAPLEHINFYRRRSLARMAEKAGMKEAFIPLHLQYRYPSGRRGFKGLCRDLLRPVMRNILRRRNYMFFHK